MSPKEECEILLDSLLSASVSLLEKNGEFYPIGAVLSNDAVATFTAVHSGNEFPDSRQVIQELISAHKQMAQNNEIKASGIAWTAVIASEKEKSDAIIVSLEHRDEYSVMVGLPYKIDLFKKTEFGELFAQRGNSNVF